MPAGGSNAIRSHGGFLVCFFFLFRFPSVLMFFLLVRLSRPRFAPSQVSELIRDVFSYILVETFIDHGSWG